MKQKEYKSTIFIEMPKDIKARNASSDFCDMAEGPCSCGAWHKMSDWPMEMRQGIIESWALN